jgi:hypothetical protein
LCGLYGGEGDGCPPIAGYALMGAGATVMLGVALPMMVVGGKDVPREPTGMPTVRLGPTGGSLHWSF